MVHVSDGSDPVYMTASGCTKTRRLGGSPDLVLGKGCKMTMAIPLVRTRLIEPLLEDDEASEQEISVP
jgi:hypothetical protein